MRILEINIGDPDEAVCNGCECLFPISEFPVRNDRSGKYRPYCRGCANDATRARYASHKRTQPFKLKATRVRAKAKAEGLNFDLDEAYLKSIWTGVCPAFKVEIYLNERERTDELAAELDKIDPRKGYVKGNVAFLSRRANRLKNNATLEELENIVTWMKQHENS